MDITLLARERRHVTKYATPTKKPSMNLLMANDIKRMMSVHARSSLEILDSGAGVGERWRMTDISRSSTYSIQGAFGEPTVQAISCPRTRNERRHLFPQQSLARKRTHRLTRESS